MSNQRSPRSTHSNIQNASPTVPSLLQEALNMQNLENFLTADLNFSAVELDDGAMIATNEKIKSLDAAIQKLNLENKNLKKELSEVKEQVLDSWDSIFYLNGISTNFNSIHAKTI